MAPPTKKPTFAPSPSFCTTCRRGQRLSTSRSSSGQKNSPAPTFPASLPPNPSEAHLPTTSGSACPPPNLPPHRLGRGQLPQRAQALHHPHLPLSPTASCAPSSAPSAPSKGLSTPPPTVYSASPPASPTPPATSPTPTPSPSTSPATPLASPSPLPPAPPSPRHLTHPRIPRRPPC